MPVGTGGLVFVDGAGPLLCQRTGFVAVAESRQRVDRQGCAFAATSNIVRVVGAMMATR
jgi:hypothetical protein